ncbi:hypothetical protein C0Q70_04222 [Pomacea canaliculata]|uniref:Uncharacterized protein n=1 Tax=Pomacea canaliculata TaxID=400727 RepID=A0A2T7PV21_POMCA|nr:hypothetical protein C0Q70_04222 [Pomacea canaliculata]
MSDTTSRNKVRGCVLLGDEQADKITQVIKNDNLGMQPEVRGCLRRRIPRIIRFSRRRGEKGLLSSTYEESCELDLRGRASVAGRQPEMRADGNQSPPDTPAA